MQKRNGSLDVLKFCAMVLIVCHHYQQIYNAFFYGINFFGGRFQFGWVVELFFELSGFVIIKYIPRIKNGMTFKEFYAKRYLRVAPAMILSILAFDVIFSWKLVLLTGSWKSEKITIWNTLISCLGIQNGWVVINPGINKPLWYISILLLCYVIFYLTTFLAARMRVSETGFYCAMILLGIAIQTFEWEAPFLMFNTARGYIAFFYGILLGIAFSKRKPGRRMTGAALLMTAGLTVLILNNLTFVNDHINLVMTFLYYPSLIIIFNSAPLSKVFDNRFSVLLGRVSFAAYIWHNCCFELIDIFNIRFHLEIRYGSYRTLALCFMIMLAWAFFADRFIERPLEKKVHYLLNRWFSGNEQENHEICL